MRPVLLATCARLPDGDEDAPLLDRALRRRGVDARWARWDDESVIWDDAVVVLRSTWDYTAHRDAFLDWMGRLPTVHNGADVVAWNSDKTYLRDLRDAGVPIVPTAFAVPGDAVELPASGEFVVKPSVGAGSRGAGRFAAGAATAARAHADALHAAGRTVLVQPYLAEVDTAGETALVYLDGRYSHAVRKGPMLPAGATHALEADALYVAEQIEARTPSAAELEVGEAVLAFVRERFGADQLYTRVDLLPSPAGPVVIEVELVEPSLFLGHGDAGDAADGDAAADRLAAAVAARMTQTQPASDRTPSPEGQPFPAVAAERLRALRRMKAIAGSMLLVAAVVYIVCRAVGDGSGAWGYVQAAAEASMVGGLADWFAVTALFRHPLRLPIPHTAIIPNKKDQIGEGLATFVQQYFLTSDILRERLEAAQVPQRVGDWLAEPTHARRLAAELATAIGGMATVLRDDELRNAVANFADKRLREVEISPILGRLLDALCDSGQHQAALTSTLRGVKHFLDENRTLLRVRVAEESPEWVPEWVDDRVFNKGFALLQSFLADVVADDDHGLRKGFDGQLRAFAERLRSDPEQRERVEQTKLEILDHPAVHENLGSLWETVKQLILDGAADPDSDLRRSAEALTIRAGEVLRDDPNIRDKVNEGLDRLAGHVATHYGDDLAAVISTTVARWDTEQTSRRLELQVGRDLQFIRINGTVVGALAGLAIYTLTQLF